MAGISVVEMLGLLCLVFQILVNQVNAARTVKLQKYPIREQEFRMKRSDISASKLIKKLSDSPYKRRHRRSQEECEKDGPVDKDNGFSWINDKDLVAESIYNGSYFMKVSWKTPKGKNGSSPVGYWFTWMVFRYGVPSQVCNVLSAQKNSFVVHLSPIWKKDKHIFFSIKPLPSNFSGRHSPRQKSNPFTFNVSTTSSASTSTTATTKSTSNDRTSRSTKHTVMPSSTNTNSDTTRSILDVSNLISGENQSKEKKTSIVAIVAIATAAAVLLVGLIIGLRYWKRKPKPDSIIQRYPTGYIYVSYISESESHTKELVDFGSWFREQGYNVQMDIMLTTDKQEQLKELGPGRWSANQLKEAKNVFMILSPSYLNLCRLDEGKTDPKSLTEKENIVFSEISQIRDELSSRAYVSSRFIPVLFGVKETELPFWIKQRVVYSWPEDKMNEKLLYRIRDEVAHDNQEISDTSEGTTAVPEV